MARIIMGVSLWDATEPAQSLHKHLYILVNPTHNNSTVNDVKEWLAYFAYRKGERDIILDIHVCRGWEVDTAIVVNMEADYEEWFRNLVMRGSANVILLTE